MIRMGIDIAQSPQRSLASFICLHHWIYTYIVSWLLTWKFSPETVIMSKNALRCSVYRYTADQWVARRMSHSGSLFGFSGPCIWTMHSRNGIAGKLRVAQGYFEERVGS
jgi:hypothetical protein